MLALRPSQSAYSAFVLLVLLPLAGCGTSEYEGRMEKGLKKVKQQAVFKPLYGKPVALPGTSLAIRVPRAFSVSFQEGSMLDDKPVDERRVKIRGLLLPAPAIAYEGRVTDSAGGQIPYYLHLFAIERSKAEKLVSTKSPGVQILDNSGKLYQDLQKMCPGLKDSWVEVSCSTPRGQQIAWQKLRATGEQELHYLDRAEKEAYAKLPCAIEIYGRVEGDYLVLIVWRTPTSIEESAQIAELAPLVAGTLQSN